MNSQTQTLGLIQQNIKLMFDDVESFSAYIMNNETIQSLLNEPSIKEQQQSETTIMNYLSSLKTSKKYISFVIIYGENGLQFRYFYDIYRETLPYEQLKETTTYNTTAAYDGEATWYSSSSLLFPLLRSYDDIVVGRRINGIYDSDEKLGMVFIGINRSALRELIHNINISNSTNLLLVDDNYNIIEHNQKDDDLIKHLVENVDLRKDIAELKETTIMSLPHKSYLVSVDEIASYEWNVVSLTPLDEIHKQNNIFLRITLFTSLSLLLLVGLISGYLSRRVTLPIKRLLRSMSNFKRGDFNQYVTIESKDEIGLLTQKYNEMVAELNDLIQKVYVSQTNQKIIELRTLQAQIEPHFLYNTLDFIFLNSKMNGDDQTAEVVYSLSQLFRISLNRGKDYYQLENEIKQIQAYVNIQQARFPHLFEIIYDIDAEIEHCYTAKLLLQPIVENSIVHGFANHKKKGRLTLIGRRVNDHVQFTIEDNGIGMTKAQVESFLQPSSDSSGGYGVRNVNERLTILFGPQYALKIDSVVNQGTKVTITIPWIENENDWRINYESHGH